MLACNWPSRFPAEFRRDTVVLVLDQDRMSAITVEVVHSMAKVAQDLVGGNKLEDAALAAAVSIAWSEVTSFSHDLYCVDTSLPTV